jgi:RimJ/RimL family protein N-acetyltransferase
MIHPLSRPSGSSRLAAASHANDGLQGEDARLILDGRTLIESIDLRLREITRRDAERLYLWRMDPASRQMFRSTDEIPFEDHLRFVDAYFDSANTDRWYVVEVEGQGVGALALYQFSDCGRECECGRLVIDPARRRSGYARGALRALMAEAKTLGVLRIRAEVLEDNPASLRAFTANGFKPCGRGRWDGRPFVMLTLTTKENE